MRIAGATYVVRQVRIHQEHEVARCELEALLVRGTKAQLPGALQNFDDVTAIKLLQLQRDLLFEAGRIELRNCSAISYVPSGLLSSTITTSYFRPAPVNALSNSQMMRGRFSRSSYVGNRTV